ncbi:Ssh1p [Lachancea thermotolerans CBS 6340]|uniref:KLTH0H11066p n=1 Tax=Lachancea thermotolerans (strain ATCC 56472 / CBS 6340 / NRRL Y-8284) TaxID=559295 RepID=C5E380_LACTC|nr:KLTH0H11066p [Lachancea thermotolerans CBS 6340]CAR30491.1 KLTH0H11066p [Lachancea thermotolerans CBS 6340]
MAGFRLIELAKPFLPLLPEVEVPYEKIGFDDKVVYTIIAALIYLFGQFPLAGVSKEASGVLDPLYFLRSVFAAEPKTLLEFGVFPVVSSALIMQVLAGLKLIKVNFKIRQDRELFQTCTKLFALLQYLVLANVFIFSGYYGTDLSVVQITALNVQLVVAGFFVTLLVEVIDKGYGFASGAMAITTVTISTNFVADVFGVGQFPVDNEGHTEPQGAFINLIQSLRASHKTWTGAIVGAFNRDYLPNLTTAFLVLALAASICFLTNFRLELPIRSTRTRGVNNVYPIRLFYVGSLSVLFAYVILFYIHVGAFVLVQLIAHNNPSSIIYKVVGGYASHNNLLYVPQFPLSLLTPPKSFVECITRQPLTPLFFTTFLVITGIWFAGLWQQISGSSARDISEQFKEQGITLTGRREQGVTKELDKIVPVAATTGAIVLGLLVACGELLGLKGKGASIIVGVSGGFALLELITAEYQQSGGQSALAQVLGAPSGGI